MSPRLTSFLDASRWIAALVVVVGHLRTMAFIERPYVAHPSPLVRIFYVLTNTGHQAVIVFFVISGFLVGGISLEKARRGRFSLGDYAAARFSRIYAVLAPALLAGWALDQLGAHFADAGGLYSGVWPYGIGALNFHRPIVDLLDWPTFIGNLAMLEGIACAHLGSNGPLWSLAYEWWYYCLFAAAVVAWTSKSRAIRLAAGAIGIALLGLLPLKISLWGVIWVVGMGAAVYVRSDLPKPPLWVGAAGFAAGGVLSGAFHHFETPNALALPFAGDLATALGFTVLLASCAQGERQIAGAGFHRWAADFSYSVYLTHFPFMLLCVGLAHAYLGLPIAAQPWLGGLGLMGGLLLLVVAYCYGFSRITEANTPQLKAMLTRRPAPVAIAE